MILETVRFFDFKKWKASHAACKKRKIKKKEKSIFYLKKIHVDRGKCGGDGRDRTADLLIANQSLSQLSYAPTKARNYNLFL